ncbi:choice-of-anchor Q domain-containing protein [uncultured Paraglaciecola sp.]|uniref:choice-of-anchor Q domain-containing protein n=1 Tax=uncultured Paraglaciecola sp. TaxID=1765024 RepID=UPI0030DB0A6A|tara:strand:- start:73472 stop:75016 length:1545 start_codon:yes stop_codon:yes gene_type:complete
MKTFNHHLAFLGMKAAMRLTMIFCICLVSSFVQGATFVVTNTQSTGSGSLAEAIFNSQLTPGSDTINFESSVFSSPQTISLLNMQLINESLIINGPGKDLLTIKTLNFGDRELFHIDVAARAAHLRPEVEFNQLTITMLSGKVVPRAFFVRNANLTLSKVNLLGDKQTLEDQSGSAIAIVAGNLTLTQCRLENFSARFRGGAVYADYSSTMQNAYFITINQSALVNNMVVGGKSGYSWHGGALYVIAQSPSNQVNVRINSSEFSHNVAEGGGGAIAVNATDLEINNSTLSNNHASFCGGAVFFDNDAPQFGRSFYITGSTITQNQSGQYGGGVMASDFNQSIILSSSVVATNTAPIYPEIAFGDITASYSLVGDNIGDSNNTNITEHRSAIGTVLQDINPMLSPLANNGGSTRTHAIQTGSPLIDAGNDHPLPFSPNFVAANFDQRGTGYPRIQAANPDMGAFEYSATTSCKNCDGGGESGGGAILFLLVPLALTCFLKTLLANTHENIKGVNL